MIDRILVNQSKKAFPEVVEEYDLLLAPSFETTTPVIIDQLISHVSSGNVDLIGAVKKVTGPRSVEPRDGTVVDDLDAVIFLDGEPPQLYQNIFPLHPDPDVRNSLAFMGQGATPFPGFALLECVAMATAQIWKGRENLPPLDHMQKWYQQNVDTTNEKRNRITTNATYYPIMLLVGMWWSFLNKTAGTDILEYFSWTSWKSWKFWWQGRELYNLCKSKLMSPVLFRLFETGKRQAWSGARSQILHDNQLAGERMRIRLDKVAQDKKRA